MENFSFQPAVSPKKKDILLVQKFTTKEKPVKLTREKKQERLDQLVDLFFDDRGGAENKPGGSDFQNKLTNFIISEKERYDLDGPFMVTFKKRICGDPRCNDNEGVHKTIIGVSSVVDFLYAKEKELGDPDKERILGFNKKLDDSYSIDVVDFDYEIVGNKIIVSRLHLVQVKSSESEAVNKATQIRKDHLEFVNNFEMMAKFQALMDLEPLPENSDSAEKIRAAIPDEILNVMVALDSEEDFDLEALKRDLRGFLEKSKDEDIDIEIIDFLGKELADELKNEKINGDEEIRAAEEIILIIDEALSKHEREIVIHKKNVVFADNAEVKSIITVKDKVIEELTTDLPTPK